MPVEQKDLDSFFKISAGRVVNVKNKETVRIEFTRPVCANKGDKIALSRRVGNNHRLIGWGKIQKCIQHK